MPHGEEESEGVNKKNALLSPILSATEPVSIHLPLKEHILKLKRGLVQ